MPYLKQIKIGKKILRFPVYFPDATRGVIRSLDNRDLLEAGIEGLILNPYHLMSLLKTKTIKKLGGIKAYMNWPGLAITDSGGWQLLSLIYKDRSFGRVTDEGVVFYKGSLGEKQKHVLTPERSIQVQMDLKADILICLDDCPRKHPSIEELETSVRRTIDWARRCKTEYEKQLKKRRFTEVRPLLLAVVQGGSDKKLRRECARELVKIGFDGYGWGGWTANKKGNLDLDTARFIVAQLPENKPKFALGVGYPWDIINSFKVGYHIFDCVIPTREARHKRLYVWTKDPNRVNILKTNSRKLFRFFYPDKAKYRADSKRVDQFCDCRLCQNHSRAYLHHLFKIGDSLAWRLSTIHNLRIYSKLIEILRKSVS
ncbi:MAG: Queuine tRNA-ribosyltransferase [Candidatus Saccharibacteria bacterium GW2011_GWA2_46_10]|nr:MAG: Queuine tRNA-ribosyltransferase [Candidatus Saccharibacteria bacterium GW2011_GWA2_46_10]